MEIMFNFTEIIGNIGMVLILTAFILNLKKMVSVNSMIYIFMNIIGGFFLVVYSYLISSFPFFILNLVWTTAPSYTLFLVLKEKMS